MSSFKFLKLQVDDDTEPRLNQNRNVYFVNHRSKSTFWIPDKCKDRELYYCFGLDDLIKMRDGMKKKIEKLEREKDENISKFREKMNDNLKQMNEVIANRTIFQKIYNNIHVYEGYIFKNACKNFNIDEKDIAYLSRIDPSIEFIENIEDATDLSKFYIAMYIYMKVNGNIPEDVSSFMENVVFSIP